MTQEEQDEEFSSEEDKKRRAAEGLNCLESFEENRKFRDYKSQRFDHEKSGLGRFVRDLKEEFGSVEYVYVWHAFCGYWGGGLALTVPGWSCRACMEWSCPRG